MNTEFKTKRQLIIASLGKEQIMELNKVNWGYEVLVIMVSCFLFISFAVFLGTYSLGFLWVLVFILQGMVLQWPLYLMHDMAIHRQLFSHKTNYLLSLALILNTAQPTAYKIAHLTHHENMNKENDSEDYKLSLNTRWKRLLMLTFIGQLMYSYRLFPSQNKNEYNVRMDRRCTEKELRRIFQEKIYTLLFFLGILVGSFFSDTVLYGYFLPLLIATPFWSVTRLIIEHGSVNPRNSLDCATFYKTSFLTAWMFFCDAGDCHLIHHLFPKIPSYKVRKAVKIMRPILLEEGVVEHRSIVTLYYFYFIKNMPYRTLWGGGAGPTHEKITR